MYDYVPLSSRYISPSFHTENDCQPEVCILRENHLKRFVCLPPFQFATVSQQRHAFYAVRMVCLPPHRLYAYHLIVLGYIHAESIVRTILANGEPYVLRIKLKVPVMSAKPSSGEFLQTAIVHRESPTPCCHTQPRR